MLINAQLLYEFYIFLQMGWSEMNDLIYTEMKVFFFFLV